MCSILLSVVEAKGEIVVSDYEAQFTVVPNESGRFEDVAVTLKITYETTNQRLSNGFKFVGKDKIEKVSVWDESGEIPFKIEELVERKISFNFASVSTGSKVVIINFLIVNAIKEKLFTSHFDATWVGNWSILVKNALYSFTFPASYSYQSVTTNFPSYTETNASGRKVIIIYQAPLTTRHFRLEVSPAINGYKFIFFIIWGVASLYIVLISIIKRIRMPAAQISDPQQPTAAEAAYLKKGFIHAVCVTVFDLIQRGFIQRIDNHYIQSTKPNNTINNHEYIIMAFFRQSATLKGFFKNKHAKEQFKREILDSLTKKGCFVSNYDKQSVFSTVIFNCILVAVVLVASGNYFGIGAKYIAQSLIISVVCTIWAIIFLLSHTKSKRAKEILSTIEQTVKRDSLIITNDPQYNPMLSYAVAIIGMPILLGTVYDTFLDTVSYARAFHPGGSTACSSCGSSSSGGDGGGSDGGGGDGGGGGCGGCGGGGGD